MKGFLVVSRGTAEADIRERYLRELELLIEERNEGIPVRRAFTNSEIRRKVRELTGENVQSVKAAMFSMKEEGVTAVKTAGNAGINPFMKPSSVAEIAKPNIFPVSI